MSAAELPGWVQEASIFAVAATSIIVAVYRYLKTETSKLTTKTPTTESTIGQVVAASFVDSKLLKELIDALREHSEEHARVSLRTTRSHSELREAVLESNEVVRLQTDATLNLLRFIKQREIK